jgi:hypothetical protein
VRLAGECIPFSFDLPPLEVVVDQLRRCPASRLYLDHVAEPVQGAPREAFAALPIDEALQRPFSLALFKLDALSGPGEMFQDFEDQVMAPWRAALSEAGFTWRRCYPIIFVSGAHCSTDYHMDQSHVVAWQVFGTKRFCWLNDPERWAPKEVRLDREQHHTRPEGIEEAETECFEMQPGDVLWNQLLTPHWVEAPGGVTYSINISHGGLRLNGELCPFEQELADWQHAHGVEPF